MENVIVIGAGIGGLCSGIRLLKNGYKVTIYEKENRVGGKVNIKYKNGAKFDFTASIMMTPHIYTEIFEYVGKNYRDYFDLIKIDPIYRVNYYDGKRYDFYSDTRKMIDVLERMQKGLSTEYMDFMNSSYKKYIVSKNEFLDKPMMSKAELLNIRNIKELLSISPLSNTSKYIEYKISNKKLREYLIFQSMYIGANPYTTSNLYTLIPAVSHAYGLWYVKGGFYNYILALEKLFKELGGELKLSKNVEQIIVNNNTAKGILVDNQKHMADIVLCNVDFPYAIKKLFKTGINEGIYKTTNIDKKDYSCSVFILYLGLNKKYKDLKVHNIYINNNFRKSIEDAFEGKIPTQPSIYMYCPSSIDDDISGKYEQILNIVVRVPNLKNKNINWDKKTIAKTRNNILTTIKSIQGLEDLEEHIEYEDYITPVDFLKRFNSYYGTAFGLSHVLNQTIYFRPHIKSKKINGLYYIGSSTHPGNGVSVIIDGTKLVEKQIIKYFKK
ncbi:MAG: phytoene desaturase family protein [Romboutsia sp.]|uniref:phytoene desaturase family protein n=1 Tax=Romboutsia sp. TaxID=1965302 RepID=UPI003F2AC759